MLATGNEVGHHIYWATPKCILFSICLGDIFAFNKLDTTDFNKSLAESLVKEQIVSLEFLEKQGLIFTPFNLNDKHDTPLYDIDPDIQFYSDQISGSLHSYDYYLKHMCNDKITKTTSVITVSLYYIVIFEVILTMKSWTCS